jgi:hypothetical protein
MQIMSREATIGSIAITLYSFFSVQGEGKKRFFAPREGNLDSFVIFDPSFSPKRTTDSPALLERVERRWLGLIKKLDTECDATSSSRVIRSQ